LSHDRGPPQTFPCSLLSPELCPSLGEPVTAGMTTNASIPGTFVGCRRIATFVVPGAFYLTRTIHFFGPRLVARRLPPCSLHSLPNAPLIIINCGPLPH